jgi:hypothetical protein
MIAPNGVIQGMASRESRRLWWSLFPALLGCMVFCSGCKAKAKGSSASANMPIADGQYLTYAVSLDSKGVHFDDSYKYDFTTADNAQWRIVGSRGNYNTGPNISYAIDRNETILTQDGSEFAKWKIGRRFNDVWLAAEERQAGKVIHPLDDLGDFTAGQETDWQKWRVIPAVDKGQTTTETLYFDAATGWLVGKELTSDDGSKRLDILSDTNIPALMH